MLPKASQSYTKLPEKLRLHTVEPRLGVAIFAQAGAAADQDGIAQLGIDGDAADKALRVQKL